MKSMSEENIQYEEFGCEIYILKTVLENTLHKLSQSCYKDQRGDYVTPKEKNEINNIKEELIALNKTINKFVSKLKMAP